MAGALQAFNEGMVLATKAGIDPEAMLEIILSSRGRSGIVEMKAPQILGRDFRPFFPLKLMAKDVRLVRETAEALGVSLPLATALGDVYAGALAEGLAAEDFAASIKPLERSAGTEVKSARAEG
jgi:3-hydroxyisobutyrate dehydrogenase-like beta-hydroxyacid dehydrogenase